MSGRHSSIETTRRSPWPRQRRFGQRSYDLVSAIAENTSVSNFRQLSFSPKAKYPTLESLQPLAEENGAGLSRLNPSQRRDLLEDRSARTEVENLSHWRRQTGRGQRSSEPGAVG